MTRKEMVDELVDHDIVTIKEDILNDDFSFLEDVLRGQYNAMTDEQILMEYECDVVWFHSR